MAYQWELHTTLPDVGRVSVVGREIEHAGETCLCFDHPVDGEGCILWITVDRALKLLGLVHEQRRLNIKLERRMFHVPKERTYEPLDTFPCIYCGRVTTRIDADMVLHSIPMCHRWKVESK